MAVEPNLDYKPRTTTIDLKHRNTGESTPKPGKWRNANVGRSNDANLEDARLPLRAELYSNGLSPCEITDKYEIEMDAVTWLMKAFGFGFPEQDMGSPPAHVKDAIYHLNLYCSPGVTCR